MSATGSKAAQAVAAAAASVPAGSERRVLPVPSDGIRGGGCGNRAERGSVTGIYLPRWFARNLPAIHVLLIGLAGFLHVRNLRVRR